MDCRIVTWFGAVMCQHPSLKPPCSDLAMKPKPNFALPATAIVLQAVVTAVDQQEIVAVPQLIAHPVAKLMMPAIGQATAGASRERSRCSTRFWLLVLGFRFLGSWSKGPKTQRLRTDHAECYVQTSCTSSSHNRSAVQENNVQRCVGSCPKVSWRLLVIGQFVRRIHCNALDCATAAFVRCAIASLARQELFDGARFIVKVVGYWLSAIGYRLLVIGFQSLVLSPLVFGLFAC